MTAYAYRDDLDHLRSFPNSDRSSDRSNESFKLREYDIQKPIIPTPFSKYLTIYTTKTRSILDDLDAEIRETQEFFDNLHYEDDEVPVSQENLDRAFDLIKALFNKAEDRLIKIKPPIISPTQLGGVDIYWKNSNRRLLISIPPSREAKITFYGNNTNDDKISGSFSKSSGQYCFLDWLNQ